jgi:hypothetical protein
MVGSHAGEIEHQEYCHVTWERVSLLKEKNKQDKDTDKVCQVYKQLKNEGRRPKHVIMSASRGC